MCSPPSMALEYPKARHLPCRFGMRVSATRSTIRSVRLRYSTSCSMEISLRSCSLANTSSCGSRAIVPSSLTTSASTPAGGSPASRARSTAASVCPRRRSTPPSW